MPTAPLFSSLHSVATILPHLSSEVQLPAAEFIPDWGRQSNLKDSLPVHVQEQTEILFSFDTGFATPVAEGPRVTLENIPKFFNSLI